MKCLNIQRHIQFSLISFCFLATNCEAKSPELLTQLSLQCETQSTYFVYLDNNSYIKDNPSNTKQLYTERFSIDFKSQDRATKKHQDDKVPDEFYSVKKNGTIYKLKSIQGAEDISTVINLSNGKYSSVLEKTDVLIRIKSNGNCLKY